MELSLRMVCGDFESKPENAYIHVEGWQPARSHIKFLYSTVLLNVECMSHMRMGINQRNSSNYIHTHTMVGHRRARWNIILTVKYTNADRIIKIALYIFHCLTASRALHTAHIHSRFTHRFSGEKPRKIVYAMNTMGVSPHSFIYKLIRSNSILLFAMLCIYFDYMCLTLAWCGLVGHRLSSSLNSNSYSIRVLTVEWQ